MYGWTGMKLVCEYFFLCERVIQDASTRTLTAVTLLEQISSSTFPSLHYGFGCAVRLRMEGTQSAKAATVQYRVARLSKHEPEEIVAEFNGEWAPGSRFVRVVVNFQTLRLHRPETLGFRLDYRTGRGRWVNGPIATLDIVKLRQSPEQRQQLLDELEGRGLPPAT